jgi:S-adenosyl methyltransferase
MGDDAWMIPRWDLERPPAASIIKPSPARLYDYFLGGKDNFAADRAAAEQIRRAFPALSEAAWANRRFHGRAAKWLANRGIRQFIDIGAGLPTMENTHQVVEQVAADTRVVYVDNDRQVVSHARALLVGGPNLTAIEGDVREPDTILGHRELLTLIDLREPVGLLITAVMHFIADAYDPWKLVVRLMGALAPGSYLALSHVTADGIPARVVQVGTEVYEHATEKLHPRSRADVARFFHGLERMPDDSRRSPGVVHADQWGNPDNSHTDSAGSRAIYWGVGQNPKDRT